MYNGIGLQTARGTGTSGYVQANLSSLHFTRKKQAYNTEDDIAKAEAEVNRKPNLELLDHEYKRRIEIKCMELQDLMENEGSPQEEIDTKVTEYRKLLFDEFESGRMNLDNELDIRNTHSRAKIAKDKRDRFRKAFNIRSDFVEGTSMANMKKPGDQAEAALKQEEEEDPEMALKKKLLEQIRAEKEAKKEKKEQRKKKEKEDTRKKTKKRRKQVSSSEESSSSSSSSSSDSSDSESSDEEKKRRKRKHKKSRKSKKSSR